MAWIPRIRKETPLSGSTAQAQTRNLPLHSLSHHRTPGTPGATVPPGPASSLGSKTLFRPTTGVLPTLPPLVARSLPGKHGPPLSVRIESAGLSIPPISHLCFLKSGVFLVYHAFTQHQRVCHRAVQVSRAAIPCTGTHTCSCTKKMLLSSGQALEAENRGSTGKRTHPASQLSQTPAIPKHTGNVHSHPPLLLPAHSRGRPNSLLSDWNSTCPLSPGSSATLSRAPSDRSTPETNQTLVSTAVCVQPTPLCHFIPTLLLTVHCCLPQGHIPPVLLTSIPESRCTRHQHWIKPERLPRSVSSKWCVGSKREGPR